MVRWARIRERPGGRPRNGGINNSFELVSVLTEYEVLLLLICSVQASTPAGDDTKYLLPWLAPISYKVQTLPILGYSSMNKIKYVPYSVKQNIFLCITDLINYAASSLTSFVLVRGRCVLGGDGIFFVRPGTQIAQLAPFGAEGAPGIALPGGRGAAVRAKNPPRWRGFIRPGHWPPFRSCGFSPARCRFCECRGPPFCCAGCCG